MSFWKRLFGRGGPTPEEPADTVAPPVARSPDLEAAIERDVDAVEPYAAYGEWLEAQGDPRGRLVRIHVELARGSSSWIAAPTRRYQPRGAPAIRTPAPSDLQRAAEALIAEHRGHFLGPLEISPRGARRSRTDVEHVAWYCGFVRALRFRPDFDSADRAPEVLAEFLEHPSARFLRALTIGTGYGDRTSVELLGDAPLPATLRSLYLGDFDFPDENEMSWSNVGDVSSVYRRAPRLIELVLQGAGTELGDAVELPSLRHLEILSGGLPSEVLRSIAASELPELETLIVWTGDEGYGSTIGPEDLRAFVDALPRFAKLRRLGIVNCEHTDAVVPMLLGSPVLPRLRELDLSLGTLTAEGAAELRRGRDRLRHLEQLDLAENLLDDDGSLHGLDTLAKHVRLDDQRAGEMDDDMRYPAVGE